ncbi:MAG: DNA polymerase I [Rhodospirillaceae bacterium]|nr:DNA polymerase I [Rhodospirillaceae bacterium]
MTAKRLYLIDGSGYIFRAFHALPPMTRPDGTPVNAVYGFSAMLMKLLDDLRDHAAEELIAVVFDAKRATFRNEIYPEYKAHRPPAPEELVPQFAIIRDAVRAFNVPCIEREGFEADDLIATYARLGREQGVEEVVVISADKDLMQLVRPGVRMRDPMKNKDIGPDEVKERFGVPPEKVTDVQALAGDSSDNIPGVPGIGVKTAAELILQYGDLENLLAHAGEIKQPKRRENLLAHAETARMCKKLVTLHDGAPIDVPLQDLAWKAPEPDKLQAFIAAQGFKSLATRAGARMSGDKPPAGAKAASAPVAVTGKGAYSAVQDMTELAPWLAEAVRAGFLALAVTADVEDPIRGQMAGIALSTGPGRGCYVPVRHAGSGEQGSLALGGAVKQVAVKDLVAALKPVLENPGVLKIGHDIKFAMHLLSREGLATVAPIDDTMVLCFVLEGSKPGHTLADVALSQLDHTPMPLEDVCGTGKTKVAFSNAPLEKATAYAAEAADVAFRLYHKLKPRLVADQVVRVYETMDRPLIPVLRAMENEGILVDATFLKTLSQDFGERIAGFEKQIHKLAGEEFNVGSPKQLGEILFERMGLPGGKKGKTGAYGTGADILEELAAQGHDLPARVLDWRQLSKLKSTYTDALVEEINPKTGRVHTTFAQTIAGTGRLSSVNPNLQNIPIRTEEGRKLRAAFVVPKGMKLISADYSQIELRLIAHVADVKALKQAFRNGEDIHAATASQMFNTPIKGMDPQVRSRAKAINFGIIYGISGFGLAAQLGIPRGEAQAYINSYFEKFPEIRDYMERTKADARKQGYVTTLFGRRCWVPYINDKNPAMRGFGERAAINAPIQGGAADIIKRAMIRVPSALKEAGLKTRMMLQVHDELVFEAPAGEAKEAEIVIREVMEGAAKLDIPLTVDVGAGPSWADAH